MERIGIKGPSCPDYAFKIVRCFVNELLIDGKLVTWVRLITKKNP